MSGVLIVDDHPIVLRGCRRILEDAGIVDLLEARDAVSGSNSIATIVPMW
jgi:two-component system invasion response regulator UvrY